MPGISLGTIFATRFQARYICIMDSYTQGFLRVFANIRNRFWTRFVGTLSGFHSVFANIRNTSVQYSQWFLPLFANACKAIKWLSSCIRKYSQRKFSIIARISSFIRKCLQRNEMVFFVYSQIFATHLFHIRNVFFVYSQFSKFYQIKFPTKEFNYIKKQKLI